MLTLLISQDDWFVYRFPHVVIGRQGISMLGTVGICLLTSRHVLRWISGLHHLGNLLFGRAHQHLQIANVFPINFFLTDLLNNIDKSLPYLYRVGYQKGIRKIGLGSGMNKGYQKIWKTKPRVSKSYQKYPEGIEKRRLHPRSKKTFKSPKKKDVYIPEAKRRFHPRS